MTRRRTRLPILPAYARPLVFAHRGVSTRAPENTIAAFELAVREGVPGVELDVHQTADGKVVVTHDDSTGRVADSDRVVAETSAAELRTLDFGAKFGSGFEGQRIPFLDEVFETLGPTTYLDIEMKCRSRVPTGLEQQVAQTIARHGAQHRCIVSSFNPYALRSFRTVNTDVPIAVIYSSHDGVPPVLRHGAGRFIVGTDALKPHHPRVGRLYRFVMGTIEGYPFLPWTIDDRDEALRVLAHGADGVITNDPRAILTEAEVRWNPV